MRINRFVAQATGMSRRAADIVVGEGRITINGEIATAGSQATTGDRILLDHKPLALPQTTTTILLNKPVGYVCSRDGQGSRTIYELLPPRLHELKPIGRLDKYSSGLLLLTNDGELAQQLTHPKYQKTKVYEVTIDKPLTPLHQQMIADFGVQLADGPSKFALARLRENDQTSWQITMHEGRNRQIRRTFFALGYEVIKLRRTQFGAYQLTPALKTGTFEVL
jgi:23S rRNA pseudouridine2605 synthase